jgi:hypothetical protein
MVLQQRKFTDADGMVTFALEPGTNFPEEHAFTSDQFTELALAGVATLTEKDTVKMTYANGEATYTIRYKPGESESEQIDAWVLDLVKSSVGKDGAKKMARPEILAVDAGEVDKDFYERAMAHNKMVAKQKGGE